MNDTPAHIRALQLNFFLSKTGGERLQIGLQMMDEGRRLVECQLRSRHPDWSDGQIIAAVFERFYKRDFSTEQLTIIKQSIIDYHDRSKQTISVSVPE